ncbi:hypothetical protein PN36_10755 [Candidatus Thiomargarita nelsonii]|uniref:Uncharacterized protein n=1 Tax=Candidatus Thiomargarita nelsonii TaxID=1003181 RepID=A0A0A6P7Y3_9GAMM|nr:hypothetical protein PN36_10755 [Candidatus Thiomargarita nelsonii]
MSEPALAALLQDCEIGVLSQLLLEHLQSQTASVLNPSLIKFLAYKNLLGHAVLFFLREQLRDNPRFERTLAALRQEGMLFSLRDFKQAQVDLKSSLEKKLSAIEQHLAAQNERLIVAASPDDLSQLLDSKVEVVIAALSNLQYVVEKIASNVEMILAELRELAARIDVSAKRIIRLPLCRLVVLLQVWAI